MNVLRLELKCTPH